MANPQWWLGYICWASLSVFVFLSLLGSLSVYYIKHTVCLTVWIDNTVTWFCSGATAVNQSLQQQRTSWFDAFSFCLNVSKPVFWVLVFRSSLSCHPSSLARLAALPNKRRRLKGRAGQNLLLTKHPLFCEANRAKNTNVPLLRFITQKISRCIYSNTHTHAGFTSD